MNSKTAKKLRKLAMGMALMAEEKGQTIKRVAYVENKHGSIAVSRNSWKGAYKALKNGMRKEQNEAWSPTLKTPDERKAAISL